LLALALDPEVPTAEDAMGERILDAALALAAASGLRHLTMDDVAQRARVGRMTVYRRFGGRAQLIDALAVRECRRCLSTIAEALKPDEPAQERVAAATAVTLRLIREHPLLARLARAEPEALLYELNRDDSAVFRLVREFLVDLIRDGQAAGELPPLDPTVLAELAVRLGASFVLIPDSAIAADEATARRLARALLPWPGVHSQRGGDPEKRRSGA
jgi:AcrR family transcriptional regulator